MEFGKLQNEFKSYLQGLKKSDKSNKSEENSEKKYDLQNKKVSIFSYADEFDNFLKDKYKDEVKNSTMSVSDILKLDFKDGQFVEKEQGEKKLPLIGILNDLLKDEKMKFIIDSDNDSKISQAEIKEFLDAIENFDGNKDDISIDDVLSGTKAIQELDLSKYVKADSSAVQNAGGASGGSGAAGAGGASGSGGATGNYGGNSVGGTSNGAASSPSGNVQQGESLEQLEQKKTQKEGEVSKAQEDYNAVLSGDNANVKAAQEKYNTSKENYEKLLEEEKNLTEEEKKQLEEATKTVEGATKAVDDAQKAVQDADNAIKTQEGVVSGCEANVGALKASLGELEGQHSDNSEKQAEINSKISDLRGKISDAESKLNDEKTKLEDLKGKKSEAEKTLTEKKEELTKAKEAKTELEKKLIEDNEKVSKELKDALKTFRDSETNVENVKNTEMTAKKGAIDKAQGELDTINKEIEVKKAEETKKENTVSVAKSIPEGTLKGVLAGKEAVFEELCEKYGVEPKFAAAVLGTETGFGEAGVAKQNNPMSYRASGDQGKDARGFGIFSTPEKGLEAGIRNLARYKDDYPGISAIDINNVDAIGKIYCEGGEWAGMVRQHYNSLP